MSRFGLWKFLNRDTRMVQVAADLVAYALTLISGPLCDRWARGIQDKLALKVLGNPLYHIPPTHADNNPALWDWFVREFTLQFTDSAEENAFAALQKLELKENDADTYINRFIELAEKAQWGLDAPGTIRLFRDGLPVNMHRAICRYQHLPRDMNDWFEATREECKRYNDMTVSIGLRGGAGNISTHQNRLRSIEPPKLQQKRKDPNAMEVDAIKTGRLSDEEKAKLLKEGRCFCCKKMGHLSRNCPDKKDSKGKGADKPRSNSGQFTKPKAHATIINKDEEEEQQEERLEKDDEAPPSYTNKGVKEFIRTMKLDEREALLEMLTSQGF